MDRPPGHAAQKVRFALMVIKANVQFYLSSMPGPCPELSGLRYFLIKILFEAGPDQVCLLLLLIGWLSPKNIIIELNWIIIVFRGKAIFVSIDFASTF